MMKNLKFLRKIPLSVGLILLVCIPNNQAQSVKRQCISSYGAIMMSDDAAFMQTVGQSYNTTASIGNTNSILQGFQQPVVFKVEMEDPGLLNNLNLDVYPNPAT